jgi:hypothetical protein
VKRIPEFLADALGIAGAVAVSYGCSLIFEPAGFIVAGLFAIAAAAVVANPRR